MTGRQNYNRLREPRRGVLLHYDASRSDTGALEWLTKDPRCKVSYNLLVLDDGEAVPVAPMDQRAWHAGVCHPSDPRLDYRDANSALYGLSIAAGAGERVTPTQLAAVVRAVRTIFAREGWSLEETWRVVGHHTEAWPRGRKVDPVGPDPARPVMAVDAVREALAA